MSAIAKNNAGAEFEPIEAGTYMARCYQILHLGTVSFEYQGAIQHLNKVRFGFELPLELKTFKEGEEAKPRAIWEEYTLTTNEKGNLSKIMKSWRGREFTADELEGFDVMSMVGKPCMIGISTTSKNGKTYNNITSISAPMKGMDVPPQINPTQLFDYDENFNTAVLQKLPKFVQEKIMKTPEYIAKVSGDTGADDFGDFGDAEERLDVPFI